MTTQPPAVLDEHTRKMNEWFEQSFKNHMRPHIKDGNECFDDIGDGFEEIGRVTGQQAQKIFDMLEIVGVLATGNEFLRGRISQITKEFKHQNGIKHKEVVRTQTRSIQEHEEHHSSKVREVVSVIDEILEN